MTTFKVTKESANGQKSSIKVQSKNNNTVKDLLQHKEAQLKELTDWKVGESLIAEQL